MPSVFRHSLFDGDLIRRLGSLWESGPSGDPWPQNPPLRSIWEGALPALREAGEGWGASVSEYFNGPDTAVVETPVTPPSVDEVLTYHRSFEKLEEGPARERLWRDAISRLRAEGYPHLPPENETYASFRARLEAVGPHLADRIVSLRNALTLLHNHESLGRGSPALPVAVLIGPAADYNGAFSSHRGYPLLDSLISSGRFHVLYFESADEAGARDAMMAAHEGTGRRLHTVVFAGHGLPTALALGGPDPGETASALGPEEAFLDINDLRAGDLGDLNAILDPCGQVLMWSCSNGAGGAEALNLANGVAESVPDRLVYSTPIPSNISQLLVREDLSLEITWRETEGYVASYHEGDLSVLRPEINEAQEIAAVAHGSPTNANAAR